MIAKYVTAGVVLSVVMIIASDNGIGPIPSGINYYPRLLTPGGFPNKDANSGRPSCTSGKTVVCRGRLPDEQANGTLEHLFVERCDPASMKSLSLKEFGGQMTFLRLDCEYDRDRPASLKLETDSLVPATALTNLAIVAANVRHLPARLFCDVPRLGRLDLTLNRLTNLSEMMSSFDDDRCGASNLQELILSRNYFETISDDSFAAFVLLNLLDLSDNRLINLDGNALRNMQSLRYLNLKGNRLSSLPENLFVPVASNLTNLDLTDNVLVDDGVYPALDIRPPIKLGVLNLGWNRLTTVDGGRSTLFDGKGTTLLALRYKSNYIQGLPDGVFRQLSSLTLIDLSNNSISAIKSAALEGLSSLVNLGLSGNNLTHLDDDLLTHCCATSLMVLDVSDNRLRKLPDMSNAQRLYNFNASYNALDTLEHVHFFNDSILYTVDFSHNYIESVRNTTFGFLSNMVQLRLDHNLIDHLEDGSFGADERQIVALRTLRLDANRLRSIEGVFHPPWVLSALQKINLSSNHFEAFGFRAVPYGVRELLLADNRITALGEPFKYDLPMQTQLDVLDVSGNRITTLAVNSFPLSVGVLLLASNRIEYMDDFTLIDKPRITVMDLSDNKMTAACPSWFVLDPDRMTATHGSVSRPRLLISGNPLRCTCQLEWMARINADAFTSTFPFVADFANAMCSPTFHENRRGITGEAPLFIPLADATSAFLCSSSNLTTSCPCGKFGIWPGPSQCVVSQCPPTPCRCYVDGKLGSDRKLIVDCAMAGLEAPPPSYPSNVTVFYLDGNNLTHLHKDSFGLMHGGLDALTILYMNASGLLSIDDGTLERMPNLTSLYLQDNRMESLSANVFVGLSQLRVLYLFSNRLKQINANAFAPMASSLKSLGMHSNLLHEFEVWKMTDDLRRLSYVTLAENPWSCECEFVELFRFWLQDFPGVIEDKNKIACTNAGGRSVQLSNDILCRNDTTTLVWMNNGSQRIPIGLTISLVLAFVVLIIASLLVYFRHEVQVLVYSRYGVRLLWLTHRKQSDALAATTATRSDSDKLFDAFISYSSLDEELVVQLVERLERGFDPPYKLCLHHRNFVGGALITESIIEAVENSCRTILLVSENFLASVWCRFEFRAAYLQMLRDRRNRVIVVLVGPLIIDRTRIDREINYYLKTNTYLRWDDRLFWKKLSFALPDRQQMRQEVQVGENLF